MNPYTLTVPEDVYQRARQIAEETAQPVEEVLIAYLRTLSSPLPMLAADEEAEKAAEQTADTGKHPGDLLGQRPT